MLILSRNRRLRLMLEEVEQVDITTSCCDDITIHTFIFTEESHMSSTPCELTLTLQQYQHIER